MAMRTVDRPLIPNVQWDQQPCVQALKREEAPSGGRTTYFEPRPVGKHAQDVTSFVYGLAMFSHDNPPGLIYMLNPPPERQAFTCKRHPLHQKRDANGAPMFEKWPLHVDGEELPPRPLLNIPGLPDVIGSKETWLFIELLRRLDPRIGWQDIIMRMEPAHLPRTPLRDRKLKNRLQMTNSRLHYRRHKMVSWYARGTSKRTMGDRKRVLRCLTKQQISSNTTRGATPGLINPSLPDRPGNRIPPVVYQANHNQPRGERSVLVPKPEPSTTASPTLPQLATETLLWVREMSEGGGEIDEEEEDVPIIRIKRVKRAPENLEANASVDIVPATKYRSSAISQPSNPDFPSRPAPKSQGPCPPSTTQKPTRRLPAASVSDTIASEAPEKAPICQEETLFKPHLTNESFHTAPHAPAIPLCPPSEYNPSSTYGVPGLAFGDGGPYFGRSHHFPQDLESSKKEQFEDTWDPIIGNVPLKT